MHDHENRSTRANDGVGRRGSTHCSPDTSSFGARPFNDSERTYELYRERDVGGVPLTPLLAPKACHEMRLKDWLNLLRGQKWDTCILVKGAFEVGSWSLDLAAQRRFGKYLTIEHLSAQPAPPRGKPYLGFIPRPRWRWYPTRFKGSLRSLGPKKIVCVSETGRKRLVEDYHFPKRKVFAVRNGIDADRFRPNPEYRAKWRGIWGIPEDAFVFGAISRFSPRKKYDVALNCFRKVIERFPDRDLRMVLVGEGPHEAVLRSEAARLSLSSRVIFSPFMSQPWEPLNAIDVFVMPSINEGLPLALVEAMACSCCPVATAVGGIPEVVNDPEVGWLVPAGDAEAFTRALIDAASRTPAQLTRMGRLAHEHIVKTFNARRQFSALADLIESLEERMPAEFGEVRKTASGDGA
jgi:glycosyltransferase involved in cell wall biosynthesis